MYRIKHDCINSDYYIFVGWVKDIENFKKWSDSLSSGYTKKEVSEIIDNMIKDAEIFREEELKYKDGFGAYELQVLENTAISIMPFANKLIRDDKECLIAFGRYLGGAYVFRKRKYGE